MNNQTRKRIDEQAVKQASDRVHKQHQSEQANNRTNNNKQSPQQDHNKQIVVLLSSSHRQVDKQATSSRPVKQANQQQTSKHIKIKKYKNTPVNDWTIKSRKRSLQLVNSDRARFTNKALRFVLRWVVNINKVICVTIFFYYNYYYYFFFFVLYRIKIDTQLVSSLGLLWNWPEDAWKQAN